MFGYACTISLFPLALHRFEAQDMKALDLGSIKREEDMQNLGR